MSAPEMAARNCAWLEACGYPGLKLLLEARADERRSVNLVPDAMGLDLENVSCVFLGPAIAAHVASMAGCSCAMCGMGLPAAACG